jgi:hypothetical protein
MTALPFLGAMVSEMEIGGEITDEGSLAIFAAIRRASSRVTRPAPINQLFFWLTIAVESYLIT